MVTKKDFYGGTVTDAIAEACQEFSTSQEGLDIEILETGSSGIFGLCRKKAHIRVAKKENAASSAVEAGSASKSTPQKSSQKDAQESSRAEQEKKSIAPQALQNEERSEEGTEKRAPQPKTARENSRKNSGRKNSKKPAPRPERRRDEGLPPPELPSDEVLAGIQEDISAMLSIMGFPSTVTVTLENYTVACHISDDYEDELVGKEGRTLDSLQYLLRKITSRRLPERIMLSLDVGTYRERRAEELKELALELAAQVREEGKTQAIPALNPSERRVVHMVLQDDHTIRSRSVGAGLFKKVLIYKPGRKKPYARKGKGKKEQQGERASDK
ncbi:MAG: Jag N-terminal domain-containing protein [Candidatus Electrothrix scaldis]|nr:MAG: Jag N-terminal domain-containing protein [Candidatus Electrothrix sp. GW3-3]